ncbi:U-box domain-containing protein [Trifolium repens]|nr:U-box domain-containing protein [Trifolium repens]
MSNSQCISYGPDFLVASSSPPFGSTAQARSRSSYAPNFPSAQPTPSLVATTKKYVRYTAEQIEALEKVYVECPKPSSMSRQQLIQENPVLSNIELEQIKVWFKNRREFISVREVGGEIEEEPNIAVVDKAISVAVSKDVKESKLNLIWAIQNSGGKKICILFVHVPATMIPLTRIIHVKRCFKVEAYDLANLSKNVGSKVWKGNPMNLLKGPMNLYGKSDAINDEIEAATSATNAHSFITLLPKGYNIQWRTSSSYLQYMTSGIFVPPDLFSHHQKKLLRLFKALTSPLSTLNMYVYGLREEVDKHAFFTEPSGTMSSLSTSSMDDSWQLKPLTISSSSSSKQRNCTGLSNDNEYSYLQLQSLSDNNNNSKQPQQQDQIYYISGSEETFMKQEKEEPHLIFDECGI